MFERCKAFSSVIVFSPFPLIVRIVRVVLAVIIADRTAAHSGGIQSSAERWNKMALDVFQLPIPLDQPNFMTAPQLALMAAVKADPLPLTRPSPGRAISTGKVTVVYVDSQDTDRKLSPDSHTSLEEVLLDLEAKNFEDGAHVIVRKVQFEHMSPQEQLLSVFDADVSERPWPIHFKLDVRADSLLLLI